MVNVDTYTIPMDHYGQTYWPIGILPMSLKPRPLITKEKAIFLECHLELASFGRICVFLLMCLRCYPCLGCVWPCFCMPKFYSGRLTKEKSHHFSGVHCGSKEPANFGGSSSREVFFGCCNLTYGWKLICVFFGGVNLTGLILWGRKSSNIFGSWGPIWVERQIHEDWGCPFLYSVIVNLLKMLKG